MAMTHAAGETSAANRGESRTLFDGSCWPLIVLMWAVFAATNGITEFPTVIDRLSTDDATRLVEVRDLLAGQSWWDLVQHRLNPPDGVVMHWSRVIDLPIALMLAGFRLLFAEDVAVSLTVTLWPALLLLPTLFAAASASRTLAGPAAAILGAFMMVMSPGVTGRFAPGAIDHHGAQVALALTLLACALKIDRSRAAAVGGGLCAAVMMAIGMETAPHVAACAALIALRWGFSREDGMARGAALFGATFGSATLAVALLTLAPSNWLAPVCDTLGIGHIAVAAVGGFGLAAAVRLSGAGLANRLSALAVIGVMTVLGLLAVAPNCLSTPFAALPERLRVEWLARVQEAQPFIAMFHEEPTQALGMAAPLAATILVALWALWTAGGDRRWPVLTAAAMLAVSCAVTLWQIRGVSLAFAMAGPLLPLAVLAIGRQGKDLVRTLLGLAALSPATLALTGLGAASAMGLPPMKAEAADKKVCSAADYRALSALPTALALNTVDTGPFILAFSPHSVVAAPYHRNVDGIMANLESFGGSDEAARAIALSRGAAYVIACVDDSGVIAYANALPDGFAAKLVNGPLPQWLAPVELGLRPGSSLRVYRVVPGRP